MKLTPEQRHGLRRAMISVPAKRLHHDNTVGTCVFCRPGFGEGDEPSLIHDEHWHVVPSAFPFKRTSLHLLVIPKRHITNPTEMTREEHASLYDIQQEIYKMFDPSHLSMGVRYGPENVFGGASQDHLHYHFIKGNYTGTVQFRMAICVPKRFRKKLGLE